MYREATVTSLLSGTPPAYFCVLLFALLLLFTAKNNYI